MAILRLARLARVIAVDTETTGDDIRDGRGYCMGVSIAFRLDGETHYAYFPFRHPTGGNLPKEVLAVCKDVIEKAELIVCHNVKFDLVSLGTLGIYRTGPFHCTMLMAHLINENRPFIYDLNHVAALYLGEKTAATQKHMTDDLKQYIKVFGWAAIPAPMMRDYAEQDAVLPLNIMQKIWPIFESEGLIDYWEEKQKFVKVIIAMESLGVRIDTEVCRQQAQIGRARMEEIAKELGDKPVGKYLEYLLLEKLGLPVYKRSLKTNKPSFDKEAMELYDLDLARRDSKIAQLILEYRGWQKAVTSNYEPYLRLLSPDGRLRPNYKLHGTKTGRMSCTDPNLQQIPRVSTKPWHGNMKAAFIPEEGYGLWEADYSQLEFRLGTAYAEVDALLEVFADPNRDIFTEMSGPIDLPRQDTKTFVYLTQYGGGVNRTKISLGVTTEKAREIRNRYFSAYPEFKWASDKVGAIAKSRGRVRLWTGRWRHFVDPEKEAHKAFNSVIQGGAADIVERVMVRLYEEVVLPSNDECRMLLQVHDSVVFEIKKGCEEKYHKMIYDIMADVDHFSLTGEPFGVVFRVKIKEWGSE